MGITIDMSEELLSPDPAPTSAGRRGLNRRVLLATLGLGAGAAVVGTAAPASAATTWSNPTLGRITAGYKSPSYPTHLGTDVANSQGTAIWAASSGTVVGVRTNSYPGDTRTGLLPGRTGNGVLIEHAGGYRTYYGHLHSVNVSVGQSVTAGQRIAGMGTTGNSTGNHLHFEVHLNQVTTNPYTFLQGRGITLGSTAPAAGGWPTLKQGSTGARVTVVQYLLTSRGYSTVADGDFGAATTASAKRFQSAKGLAADGIVGPVSWPELVQDVGSGSSGDKAKAAQTGLNIHGAGLLVDGDFGGVSVTAAKRFQSAQGLVADGLIGPITWAALV
ncbi:peptidoglycan DD-metalloendopeptidase family protein [Phytomonospora sp. NPDC050363]|uniref:peptidoglycan DD-metalloendopeptidase family protein n=1 Tax=Phytomonospora sp. NPDC050363 TaxID=3155642 RepID=UPI0033E0A75D